jgi:glycogen synthase
LADTVFEGGTSPNGLVFEEFNREDFSSAVERAINVFHDKAKMGALISDAINQRNGWDTRIPDYERIFQDAKPGL